MKVLVLGDGLLGGEIVKHSEWDCFSRKKNGFDIKDLSQIPKGYDVILNCIANTDTYSNNRDSHWDTNYAFVNRLIDYCNNNSIKLVQISTDYVYAGSESLASESSVPVHCENWYGYTKLLSDGIVQLRSNNYLLFRCTQIPNPFPYDEAWIDRIGNLDYVDVISNLIIKAIKNNLKGLYNLGTEVKTTYDLAKQTKPNVSVSFKPNHVPSDVSMNISKLNKDLNKVKRKAYLLSHRPKSERTKFSYDILTKIGFEVEIAPTIYHENAVISNKISMQSIYESITKSSNEWTYVFEDDVNTLNNIELNEIVEYEKISNQFFYLGCCLEHRNTIKLTPHEVCGHKVFSVSGACRCLHAIGLSREGAKNLLNFSKTLSESYMDIILDKFSESYPANIVRYDLENLNHISNGGNGHHVGVIYQDREKFKTDIG